MYSGIGVVAVDDLMIMPCDEIGKKCFFLFLCDTVV